MTETEESSGSAYPRPRERLVLTLMAALGAVAILVAAGSALGVAYVKYRSGACTGACHTKPPAGGDWHAAGHAEINCQACHRSSASTSLGLVVKRVFGSTKSASPHGTLDAGSCVECHSQLPQWTQLTDTSGHRRHASARTRTDCTRCHAASLHYREPIEKVCVECHEPARLHKRAKHADTCLSCHNFSTGGDTGGTGLVSACGSCHGDRRGNHDQSGAKRVATADVLHGTVDCRLCHQPHFRRRLSPRVQALLAAPAASGSTKPGGSDAEPPSGPAGAELAAIAEPQPCHDCHEIQFGLDAAQVPPGHQQCSKCHQQHAPRRMAEQTCHECHEQARSRDADGQTAALQHESCTSCHIPHDWVAERSGCVRCHEEQANSLLTRSPEEHRTCLQCHDIHGPPPTGAKCASCHKDKKGHLASAPPRHRNCATCHNPHAASELPVKVCANCHHAEVGQLATGAPPQHRRQGCLGCHRPHGSPVPDSSTCGKCHAKNYGLVKNAGPAPHQRCASCHAPHKFVVASVKAACSRCHASTVEADGPHSGSCEKCHSLHGSPAVTRAACADCHSQARPGQLPRGHHNRCASCHQPHRPAGAAGGQCASCHQDKQQVARTWPSGSPHAGQCADCHRPHDPQGRPACGSCHSAQAASARGGKHRCAQCHAPHQPPAGSTAGWWKRCDSCHAGQVSAARASRASTHQVCSNCHQPHAFKPPACTSCHAAARSQGGHAVTQHRDCSRCHSSHTVSKPGRDECLSCHRDRRTHHPEAERCYACHPFR